MTCGARIFQVVQFLINSGATVSRDLEFLSLQMASPVDFATESFAKDRQQIEHILAMKGDMERSARRAAREAVLAAKERQRLEEAELRRKEELARERRARFEDKLRARAEALRESSMARTNQRAKRAEQKRAERDEKRLKEHQTGLWVKAAERQWEFQKGFSAWKVKEKNLMNEVSTLNEEIAGVQRKKAVRRRWKTMTGTRLVELDEDGQETTKSARKAGRHGGKPRLENGSAGNDLADDDGVVEIPALCI